MQLVLQYYRTVRIPEGLYKCEGVVNETDLLVSKDGVVQQIRPRPELKPSALTSSGRGMDAMDNDTAVQSGASISSTGGQQQMDGLCDTQSAP